MAWPPHKRGDSVSVNLAVGVWREESLTTRSSGYPEKYFPAQALPEKTTVGIPGLTETETSMGFRFRSGTLNT